MKWCAPRGLGGWCTAVEFVGDELVDDVRWDFHGGFVVVDVCELSGFVGVEDPALDDVAAVVGFVVAGA